MTMGSVDNLIGDLRNAEDDDERKAILHKYLDVAYSSENLARMVMGRYRNVAIIKDFSPQIEEAIESAQTGNLHAGIVTLMTVVEGLIREVGKDHNVQTDHKAANLGKAVQQMIDEAANGAGQTEQIQQMLRGFKRFFAEKLYIDTRTDGMDPTINRHAILHGFCQSYGKRDTFAILVSVVDHMTFLMTMRTSGISAVFPPQTPESTDLFAFYQRLAFVAASRPRN